MKKTLPLSLVFVLAAAALLPAPAALAQDKVIQLSEKFAGATLTGYSLLDRTRIL
jgi:hypothetical protein